MAISFPLSLPSVGGISSIDWRKDSSVVFQESPFSKKLKVYDYGGKRFSVMVEIAAMQQKDAKQWEAFFLSLNGPEGTFWLPPSVDAITNGIATGTPLVNGASQTGQELITDGWTASQTGILKAGDWIQVGNYLYRILEDENSDGSGNATFDIWPNLRASPSDNDPIITTSPKGLFRLLSMPPLKFGKEQLCEGFKFEAVEAI